MKRNALPLLICLLPAVALAQTVYESQYKEGPVFSDTPSPGAQPVDLPPANVIDNPTPVQQQSQPAASGYTSVVILSPQAQGTVHSNTGEFQVTASHSPRCCRATTPSAYLWTGQSCPRCATRCSSTSCPTNGRTSPLITCCTSSRWW